MWIRDIPQNVVGSYLNWYTFSSLNSIAASMFSVICYNIPVTVWTTIASIHLLPNGDGYAQKEVCRARNQKCSRWQIVLAKRPWWYLLPTATKLSSLMTWAHTEPRNKTLLWFVHDFKGVGNTCRCWLWERLFIRSSAGSPSTFPRCPSRTVPSPRAWWQELPDQSGMVKAVQTQTSVG